MIRATRSMPAPVSLADKKTYRSDDVIDTLIADFNQKCYLCESAIFRGVFEIDHRNPKADDDDLVYLWENLFPACKGCNKHRPRTWPPGGLLDPAVEADDVEGRIMQWLNDEYRPMFTASKPGDSPAKNSAHELDIVHDRKRPAGRDVQDAVKDQLLRVLEKAKIRDNVLQQQGEADDDFIKLTAELRSLLSRKSPFTMLLRSRVPYLRNLFD